MGGRVAKRVLLAPVVIVIATTAIPPVATIQPLNEWLSKTLPASTAIISSLGEWLDKTIPPAPVVLSFQSDALTDGPQPTDGARNVVVATTVPLPAPTLQPKDGWRALKEWLDNTLLVSVAMMSSFNEWLDSTLPPASVVVSFQSDALTDGPQQTDWARSPETERPKEKAVYASLGSPAEPEVPATNIHSLLPENKSLSAKAPGTPVYASLGSSAPVSDAQTAAADPRPAEVTKITTEAKPEEAKPEEKQVYASLGMPTAVNDAQPVPDPLPAQETEIAGGAKPEEMRVESTRVFASLGSPATVSDTAHRENVEPPATISASSTAEHAPPERHASLGPAILKSEASNAYVPPEKLRVAYDAPPVAERPKSIGKRTYVDETVYTGLGSPEALLEALRHMGSNAKKLGLPASLWCADFMNMVLRKTGNEATGSRAARSYLKYGQKIDEPRVGAIAIFTRGKNGGHIGIVRGTDGKGNPIIVSGNHNNMVAEALYPKERVLAYVVPPESSH